MTCILDPPAGAGGSHRLHVTKSIFSNSIKRYCNATLLLNNRCSVPISMRSARPWDLYQLYTMLPV